MSQEENIRNTAILAHVDAGKTTLSERILYFCHAISRMGEVSDGTTVMDFLPEEQKRGITIGSACISCAYHDVRINLVDTPGHIDFTFEVDRIVRVIDGGLVVFSAVDGVEPQSEMVWRQADAYHLPRLIFINKIDREEARYAAVVDELKKRLRVEPFLLTIPSYTQNGKRKLEGIIDILRLSLVVFDQETLGTSFTRIPLQGEDLERVRLIRDRQAESLAVADDRFMELWVENAWNTDDAMAALARATRSCLLVPVICGSAKFNIGIQYVLEGIADLLPPPTALRRHQKNDVLGFVFKLVFQNSVRTAWIRLYQGSLNDGDVLFTSHAKKAEPVHLFRIDAEQIIAVPKAESGDIIAVTGLMAETGDTVASTPLIPDLAPITAVTPVLSQTFEPRCDAEYAILQEALERYAVEDPSLHIERNESGSYSVSGMGELHLEILRERLAREYQLPIIAHPPCVVKKDSIVQEASATQSLSTGASCSLTVTPNTRGSGNEIFFSCDIPDAARQTIISLCTSLLEHGFSGYPLTDIKLSVHAVAYAEPDGAYALRSALEQAVEAAQSVTLEPIMHIAVVCTDETIGNSLHELKRSHALIQDVQESERDKIIHAEAPLSDILDLSTRLRSSTKGRVTVLPTFARFDAPRR